MTTSGTHELRVDTSTLQPMVLTSLHVGTNHAGNTTSSQGLYVVPAQHSWDDSWELIRDLIVEIYTSWEEVVAITYLTVQEYGVGTSFEDAILDLLRSLSGYYQSLEARLQRLGPPATEDLEILRNLVRIRTNV